MKLPRFLANIVRQGADPSLVTRRNFDELAAVLEKAFALIEEHYETLKERVLSKAFVLGLIRNNTGELRPEWFGANRDGVTDDYQALQATLNYARDNYDLGGGEGLDIRLTGPYFCGQGLDIPDRVNLVGNRAHSAGNLNRNTARLIFTGLGVNTKALTIGEDVTLQGLVISGPGEGVSGTFGVYGGVDESEELGVNTQIINCTIEDFETPIALSRWINLIEDSVIDDCITGIRLYDRANHTIIRNNRLNPGNASTKTAVLIGGTPEGVFVYGNNIEDIYYGVVVTGGQGVQIHHNRFEIINKAAIDIRGTNTATDEDLYADIHHNYILDYGANASTSGRYGILIQAGYTTIDDNQVKRYDAGDDVGLQYGINFGAAGVLYNCLIGKNHLEAYQAIANINDEATKQKVNSRFVRTINYTWDLGDDPGNNIEEYFQFPLPSGYSALYSFRQFRTFNLDTLDAVPDQIGIGYLGSSTDRYAYLDNFQPSAVTQYQVTYATDAEWTAAGTAFLSLVDSRMYVIRMEPGSAVSGRIILTLVIDEFQY